MLSNNLLFLDLGASSLKGMVINQKRFTILAKHIQENSGIANGYINDTALFQDALCKLIKTLEKKIKGQLSATILLVGGQIVRYKLLKSSDIKINGVINKTTTAAIDMKIQKWISENKSLLVSSTPIEYQVDGSTSKNPIGLYAEKLKFTYNIAYSNMHQLGNLAYILEKHGLDIIDIIPSIYANAALYLSDDEKILGSLIFDIGAHTINWAYYHNNKPINGGSINFNHETITHKIAKSLKISIPQAKLLKHQHCSAILHADHFCTWAEFARNDIKDVILESEIIRKTLPEIELLINEINKITTQFSKKATVAVLCGNGAWIGNLTDALTKISPIAIKLNPSAQPEFDALNGALIYTQTENNKKEKNIFQKATSWLKENL